MDRPPYERQEARRRRARGRRTLRRVRFSWLLVLAASASSLARSVGSSSSSSSAAGVWCAANDAGNNFTFAARIPDRVSIVRVRLEGCTAGWPSRLAATRFALTIEPSRSNETFVATVPPRFVEPVYATLQNQHGGSSVGVLSFRLSENATVTSPARAGIRVRIPPDHLQAIVVDAGSPFYVNVRNGFARLSSIRIDAGYSLHNLPGGINGSSSSLGAQLVADLRSSNVPLALAVDGNGAKVRLWAGSTIESLQIGTAASDIAVRGDVECDMSALPCYILGGDSGADGAGTVVLLEGSVRGTISTATALASSSGSNPSDGNGTTAVPSLQIKINDPYYVGNPCASLGMGRSRNAVRCTATNETVDVDPWFPCTTPLDSSLGSVECSRTDGASSSSSGSSGVCSCSVRTADSPGVDPIAGTSAGTAGRRDASLPWWLVGVSSALAHAFISAFA